MSDRPNNPLLNLEAFDAESGDLNAIVDTPKGSRNKYKYDEELGIFELSGVMPAGAFFPYDFGYVPSTLGEDGDPIDVLILMDESAFVGCLVPARLIGVIEAEQTERDGTTTRNDRLISIASAAHNDQEVQSLDQISSSLVDEIEHFFVSYNQIKGKEFKPLGRYGPDRARQVVEAGVREHKEAGEQNGQAPKNDAPKKQDRGKK